MAINFSRQTLFYLIDVCAQSSVKYQKSLYEIQNEFHTWAYTTPCCASYVNQNPPLCTMHIISIYSLEVPCKLVAALSFVFHGAMLKRICQVFLLVFSKGKTQR
jgi:hypothetical protein